MVDQKPHRPASRETASGGRASGREEARSRTPRHAAARRHHGEVAVCQLGRRHAGHPRRTRDRPLLERAGHQPRVALPQYARTRELIYTAWPIPRLASCARAARARRKLSPRNSTLALKQPSCVGSVE